MKQIYRKPELKSKRVVPAKPLQTSRVEEQKANLESLEEEQMNW